MTRTSLIFGIFLPLCFFSPAFTADAQISDPHLVSGWFVEKVTSRAYGDSQCIAKKSFPDGTDIELSFSINNASGHSFKLENQDWTSLNDLSRDNGGRSNPIIPLSISYEGTSAPSLQVEFGVLGRSMFNPKPKLSYYTSTDDFLNLLKNLSASTAIRVTSGTREIGHWRMDGMRAASVAVLQCAEAFQSEQNRRLQNDPFRE